MLTIFAFILTILGSINWLLIGLLQYDFVAGVFGYQGSIFSRIIYIIIGSACVFLIFKLVKGKGTLAVFSRRNKKDLAKNIAKIGQSKAQNIEVSHEQTPENYQIEDSHFGRAEENYIHEEKPKQKDSHGLFDEHFGE